MPLMYKRTEKTAEPQPRRIDPSNKAGCPGTFSTLAGAKELPKTGQWRNQLADLKVAAFPGLMEVENW